MGVSTGVQPVAADSGIAVGDDHLDGAVRLVAGAVLGDEALTLFIVVEILLPQVAQLENPVFAQRRMELKHQGLVRPLDPAAETVMAIRHATIAEVQRTAEQNFIRPPRKILPTPFAYELRVPQ